MPVAQALRREVRMPNNISAGDTAWLLASAALVMLMTPALGFFYGGLVRRKNVLATIMHSFFILCLISVQWVLWGYSLAFGPDINGIIGGLDWVAFRGVGQEPGPYGATVPHEAYMVFQMMFAVITPALITGWFAFNAGSAITSGGLAANAFVVTNTAAAMAALTWMTVSWLHKGAPSVLGAAAGAVAGLVAITPASGYVDVSASILIGLGAGTFCYLGIQVTKRLRVDDALDVFGVHGVGGAWGALATGVFATVAVNSGAADGLVYGNPAQLGIQAIAVLASITYSAVMTFVILKVINLFVGLRVGEHEEVLGLDASQHRETAYV